MPAFAARCPLLDVNLSEMDGGTSAEADQATQGVRIIALTAHAMPNDREKALDADCENYYAKPAVFADGLVQIEALANRNQTQR